jgi:hypothetical protein
MEVLVKGMRGFQNLMEQGIDLVTHEPSEIHKRLEGGNDPQIDLPVSSTVAQSSDFITPNSVQKEQVSMSDTYHDDDDLGTDDLKVVRWRVIFKKRDYEVTLAQGSDLIGYKTSAASLSGIKISDFLKAARNGKKVDVFDKLKEKGYEPKGKSGVNWSIPEDDMRYVTFIYKIVERISKADDDYERRKVRALESIAKDTKRIK